jgi:hypothetical protein
MKKILLLILLANICCIGLYSQSEKILKTVEYTIDEYNHTEVDGQSLTYTLEDGGLRIRGYMLTNCCGVHVMNCLVLDEYIFLSRSDLFFLCDCVDWHFVDFVIDGVPEGDYEVYLQEYGCDLESADYAQISANTISLVKDKDYSCEYSDGQYAITLHDAAAFSDAQIKVFDCNGKPVWESTFTGSTLYIPSQDKLSICKMIINGKDYTMKMTTY